jgi:hypothetical protein
LSAKSTLTHAKAGKHILPEHVRRDPLILVPRTREGRRDLHMAEVVYSLFLRLDSVEKGRPKKVR